MIPVWEAPRGGRFAYQHEQSNRIVIVVICDEQVWGAQWSGQGQRSLPIQVSCAWVRSLVPSRTYVAGISELVMFLPTFGVVSFTIIISWLQAPRFGDWNEGT